jgi:flotillin
MIKRISAAEAFNQAESNQMPQEMMAGIEEDNLSLDNLPIGSIADVALDLGCDEPLAKKAVKARKRKGKQQNEQPPQGNLVTSEELQLEKESIKVRETGFWLWKQVIVPPNVYVVHTRMGRSEPVTIGLGKSFRYNPNTDAYLVVPAAMQTIGIVARSITKEKQGINVLAYLQWQISDFSIAYRRLDVSDSHDPLGIVNAQLSEQAEAAIKDKIATMGVEEVLTDKAPIIEELTTRLQAVTEGRNQENGVTHEGLGIKIVTVQMREALVSSQELWQDLQAPFRYQQEQVAHISQLTMQNELHHKELESQRLRETHEAETNVAIEQVKQGKQTEAFELKLSQESIRFTKEQETLQQKIQREEQTTLAKQASKLRIQAQEQETVQQQTQQEEKTALARQASEQRLKAQQALLDHDTLLTTLQQGQAKELEQARLDNEIDNKQKTLQTEQSLHVLAEEKRFNEASMQAEQQRLEQEAKLEKQKAALKLLIQEQKDLLDTKILEARLSHQQQEGLAELELEEARNRVNMALQEKKIEIQRGVQEGRNLINESDLLRRLIDKFAEIMAEMPDIHELKVLQTGHGDVTFDVLSALVAKMLAVAEHLGIPLKLANTASEKNDI